MTALRQYLLETQYRTRGGGTGTRRVGEIDTQQEETALIYFSVPSSPLVRSLVVCVQAFSTCSPTVKHNIDDDHCGIEAYK